MENTIIANSDRVPRMSKVFLLTLYIDLYSCDYIMTQMSPAFSGSRAPQDVQLAKGISFQENVLSLAPWKINMEPENGGLEDDFPFQIGGFWVPC